MKRCACIVVWAVLCMAGVNACAAQESALSARQLTVEVFSARRLTAVTMTPVGKNESMRFCVGCPSRPVTAPLTAQVHSGDVELAPGVRAPEATLEGAFRVQPEGKAEIRAAGKWKLEAVRSELRILLTMDSERYVALAVAGEAGTKEKAAVLQAMAIVARTYALENAARHRAEGFDLCDSTHCQALQFGGATAAVERAVLETAGETLWFGGRRAGVFTTQNCGGESEAAGHVWAGADAPYLREHADPYCTRHGAVEWHAEIPINQVRAVFAREGWKAPARIETVRVTKRTDAGRAVELEFAGGGERVPVTAGSLRFALDRALGWNQLRSDWYTVAVRDGAVHFDGRGYGHGVGLCEAGAAEMAAEGHSAKEILNFYFPGTRAGVTTEDRGWSQQKEAGWTLWAAGAEPELVRAGNAAWGRAEALYPVEGHVEPEVWAMPATELFRQETAEPGWMLAATRGTQVFLQPEAVLNRNGRADETLLHEFLHVLVESEAAAPAPLWLREGVVEALAASAGPRGGVGDVRLPALESQLARPESEAASQRAHAEAGRLARALIAQNGLAQVRVWLRAGSVPAAAIRGAQESR